MSIQIPDPLMRNSHFVRYYKTWQINPLSVVFIPMAEICREQGFVEEARQICEEGLAQHPRSVSGRLVLARIYFDLELYEEARKMIEGILQEFPAQKEAHTLLNRIIRCQSGPDLPLHPLPDPVETDAHPPLSLWENVTMAKIYADQGEKKIALKILDKILGLRPQDERAQRLKQEILR